MEQKLTKISLKQSNRSFSDGVMDFMVAPPGNIIPNYSPDALYLYDGFVLGLCTQGEATIRINFKEYKVKKNDALFILPTQSFNVETKSDDFVLEGVSTSFYFFVGFILPPDFSIIFKIIKNPCLRVPGNVMNNLTKYYDLIVHHHNSSPKKFRMHIIKGLLYALLMDVASLYKENEYKETSGLSRKEDITVKFFELLITHYKEERSISFYARKLDLTGKYLASIIKSVTKYPIQRWINELIVSEIKIALKTSNLKVNQVADLFHFPNPSFFGQFFKKYAGCTPYKFKKN
jgi:AraC-like DNA-binding protein